MDLISVIVPVYKVEKYLDRCVQSIVDQTYKNLEIILVDDGSPDRCGALCDAWAAKDSRIKVIHQSNAGGGAARNAALDIVQGELIAFVDSDDYISPYMLSHLYDMMAPDVDIVECDFMSVDNDRGSFLRPEQFDYRVYTTLDAMTHHIADDIFRQIIWNKLYRRKTIADIRFPVGTRIDDEFWTYRVLANASKLIHSDCCMYAYRQQPGSVMHLSFSLPRLQAVDAKCQRLDLLQERFPDLVSQARINLWHTCLYQGQMSLLHLNREDKQTAFNKLSIALAQFPLPNEDKRSLPLKQRGWACLSHISFKNTCKLRNCLKIGIYNGGQNNVTV